MLDFSVIEMRNPCQINADAWNIVYMFCMKAFSGTLIVFLVDTDLLVGKTGEKTFHGIVTEPVYEWCALKKMESVSSICDGTGMGGVGS